MSMISRSRLGFAVAFYLIFSPAMAHESGHWQSAHQMTEAASALISSLDEDQKKTTIFPLDDAARTTWSNLPIIMVRPGGLLVSDMNAAPTIPPITRSPFSASPDRSTGAGRSPGITPPQTSRWPAVVWASPPPSSEVAPWSSRAANTPA